MRLTIPFLTLFLAVCSSQVSKPPGVGTLSNNDSPIVVSDTSTQPIEVQSKAKGKVKTTPGTTINHTNHEGGKHWDKDTKRNKYLAHDKDAKDTYRPACLVFPSAPIPVVPIKATATEWHISFENNGTVLFVMSWSKGGNANGGSGDITVDPDPFSNPAGGPDLAATVQVTLMKGSIDGTPFPDVTAPPVPASPPPAKPRKLVKVAYCKTGVNCRENDVDSCTPKP